MAPGTTAKIRDRPARSDGPIPSESTNAFNGDASTLLTFVVGIIDSESDINEPSAEQISLAFLPPSILHPEIIRGSSYTFQSAVPDVIKNDPTAAVTLGVDEAGRGPVLGKLLLCIPIFQE